MVFRLMLLVAFVPLALGIHATHLNIVKQTQLNFNANQKVRLLPPAFLKLMTFGHDAFAADALWLQLIQYFGAAQQDEVSPRYLKAYFDTITSLDPDFERAYILATFLMTSSEEEIRAAIEILDKGIKANPDNYEIPFYTAFMYYIHLKDPEKAADYFEIAGQVPNANPAALRFAAKLRQRGDDAARCRTSLELWEKAYNQAGSEKVREKMRPQIAELRIGCDLKYLKNGIKQYSEKALEIWQEQVAKIQAENEKIKTLPPRLRRLAKPKPLPPKPTARYPQNLAELVQQGILGQIPQDPFQREYRYNPATGQVQVGPLPFKSYQIDEELIASS